MPPLSLNYSTSSSANQSCLRSVRQNLDAMQAQAACGRTFVPQNQLDTLLSKDKVAQMVEEIYSNLEPSDPTGEQEDRHKGLTIIIRHPEYINTIHQDYKKILALLVMVDHEQYIVDFWRRHENDKRLPFDKDRLEKLDPKLSKTSFFYKQQLFLAPEFTETLKTQAPHWGPEVVLPFLKNEPLIEGNGGFAHVFKIEIHPAYDKLRCRLRARDESNIYARKELITLQDENDVRGKEKEFAHEVFALNMLGYQKHPNILPLLAAYRHGDKYNMIFPYAERNLKNYWETNKPPASDIAIFKFLTEIFALASGLGSIHKVENATETDHCGYHRDIKPSNILNKGKKFMIADFGLALFRPLTYQDACKSNSSGVDFIWGLSTYRAPECGANRRKSSRASDIWSLGCVFAEVLAFVIWGKTGPKQFSDMRKKEYSMNDGYRAKDVDWFHDGKALKQSVLDFFKITDKKGQFISETTGIIKLMLSEKESQRPKVDELIKLLQDALTAEKHRLDQPCFPISNQSLFSNFRFPQSRPQSENLDVPRTPTERTSPILDLIAEYHDTSPFRMDSIHHQTTPSTPMPNHSNRWSLQRAPNSVDGVNVSSPTRPRELNIPSRHSDDQNPFLQSPRTDPENPLENISTQNLPNIFGEYLQSPRTISTLSRNGSRSGVRRRTSVVNPLRELRKQDTAFLIDNAHSMENTWSKARLALEFFATTAIDYDRDGVDLLFMYDRAEDHLGLSSVIDVLQYFDKARDNLEGECSSFGSRLDEILSNYLAKFKNNRKIKPLNLIVITNGDLSKDDTVEEYIIHWAKILDEESARLMQVGIQFMLIDCELDSWERFKRLDDEICKEVNVRDIVDVTPFDPHIQLDTRLLEKIMLGATNRRLDSQDVQPNFNGSELNILLAEHGAYNTPTNDGMS